MKTENTLENKAKFFALYWYQKVLRTNRNLYFVNEGRLSVINDFEWLELTPLSQITVEDVEFVKTNDGYSGHKACKDHVQEHSDEGVLTSLSVDYLRSKGYCLPYLDLSVEDLVSYGWVKIKEK